jgi:hypothetical protein
MRVALVAAGFAATPLAASADPWPGSQTVTTVDVQNALGGDVSGLHYENSGTTAPGVLWTVDNGNSRMDRLVWNGAAWARDTTNGWSAGKTLRYPDGLGRPDSEGVTMTDAGPAGGVFVSSESNLDVVASRNSILRYDVSGAGATLIATQEWDLTADLPVVGRNLGAESVQWVPDAALVAGGLVDQSTGLPYDPATYPGHGSGLFFVGIEANGSIYAYALDQSSGAFTRVHTFASGVNTFGALHWDANERRLWVVCDNTQNPAPACNGRSRLFAVDRTTGTFALVADYDRPTGMANLNNEGFAFPTDGECVNAVKPVFWADDGNTGGNVLRAGTIPCAPPKNDLLVDFSASGLLQRMNNAAWVKVHSQSPSLIATGDLDGDKTDEAIASFSGGVYARYDNAAPWVKLDSRVPARMVAGDLDGVGGEDLAAVFADPGLFVRYNNAAWTKVHSQSPTVIATGDLDDNQVGDLIARFPGGVYARYNNANPWVKLDSRAATRFAAADLDGVGGDDLIADFGAAGLWVRFNDAAWTQVRTATSQDLVTGDFDGDGRGDVLTDFGASGLWIFYNGATWTKVHPSSPVHIAASDLDGNGKDEAIADFGANGVRVRYNNGGTWLQLNSGTTEGLAGGGFD